VSIQQLLGLHDTGSESGAVGGMLGVASFDGGG